MRIPPLWNDMLAATVPKMRKDQFLLRKKIVEPNVSAFAQAGSRSGGEAEAVENSKIFELVQHMTLSVAKRKNIARVANDAIPRVQNRHISKAASAF